MPKGGKRPGAGRPKGSRNKATQKRRDIAERALADGVTPLEVMLEAMRDAYKGGGAVAASVYAKEAAPYVHPRLASIDADVKQDLSIEIVQFTPDDAAS